VAPETQAAREALEVSLELIMHKARAEFERRKRCDSAQTVADRPVLPTPGMVGAWSFPLVLEGTQPKYTIVESRAEWVMRRLTLDTG
jgi:hypothetical protein